MCAPISATIANSVASASFATSLLINQVLAVITILSIVGYKVFRIVKSI